MDSWVGAILLGLGVAGAVGWPRRLPRWALPVGAALVDVVLGVISVTGAWRAVRPLAQPVGFLLAAVPMAVLLDRLGFFVAIASRVTAAVARPGPRGTPASGRGPGYLWALAALVTTFLNLDASVVLLTPLYVRVARQQGWGVVGLGVQPVLLACLASSALPVSNLTNLIVGSWDGVSSAAFVEHLGGPSLVASVVGWWAYRRTGAPGTAIERATDSTLAVAGNAREDVAVDDPARGDGDLKASDDQSARRAVGGAGVVVLGVLAGFTFGYLVGIQPWMVALVADFALVAMVSMAQPQRQSGRRRRQPWRDVPWQSVPLQTAAIVLSLGVLALGLGAHLSIGPLLRGRGVGALARDAGLAAAGANVANNLPALLVALSRLGHHASPALWAVLLGVNMGPVLLVTGSLASLLWLSTMRRLGAQVEARDFARFGFMVGLPAGLSGLAVFLVMNAVGLP